MKTIDMKAERRNEVGSAACRRLRRDGRLPAILCGKGVESLSLHVSAREFDDARKKHARILMLQLDGASEPAVIHDVKWDVMEQRPAHVDFQRVNMAEKIEIEVVVKTKGPSKGEVGGGILMLQMDQVKVRCLPLEIPDFIEVDIRPLELHQSLHVKDLVMPKGVEVAADPAALVLAIVEKKELVVATPGTAEAGPTEPELIVKPKTEEELAAEAAAPGAKGAAGGGKGGAPAAKAEAPAKEKKPDKK
jgi:large subunit ribosomal protein L25